MRYTASGELDRAFGTRGVVRGVVGVPGGTSPPELLPAPHGGDIVAASLATGPPTQTPVLRAERVTASGRVASKTDVAIPFGGGQATVSAMDREPIAHSLRQTGFVPGRALVRPDGSLVLPGAVAVVQYNGGEGGGYGYGIDQAAVAATTPALALDPSFGGPARAARISVRVPRQSASSATDVRVLRVTVSARTSGAGLCLLRVVAGNRVIARSTAPVFSARTQRLPALLTTAGRRYLFSHAHRVRVRVTATFRDLVGAQATSHATATLR